MKKLCFGIEVERGVYKRVVFICASVALKEHCVPGRKGLAGAASSALFPACSAGCI